MTNSNFGHLFPWQLLSRFAGARMTCLLKSNLDVIQLGNEAEKVIEEFKPVDQHGDDHAGGWKSISLISFGGDPFESKVVAGKLPMKTPALQLAPYMESVLDAFDYDKQRVRMMQLLPGETMLWHVDHTEAIDLAIARIHIPIVTNSDVKFQISHEDCRWLAGEVWYGDFSFPHRVHNGGSEGRIHLVMDVHVNDRLRDLFPPEYLDNRPNRGRVRAIISRMVDYYTWPRYRSGYMKRKQKTGFNQAG